MEKVLNMGKRETVTVTNEFVLKPQAMSALAQINALDMNVKAAWSLARMQKKITALAKETREELNKLIVDKYFLKDDKGKLVPVTDDDGNPIHGAYKLKEDTEEFKTEFNKAEKDFMALENKIDLFKIDLSELTGKNDEMIEIKGHVLSELEPLFAE